jgi:hypothetical protein
MGRVLEPTISELLCVFVGTRMAEITSLVVFGPERAGYYLRLVGA